MDHKWEIQSENVSVNLWDGLKDQQLGIEMDCELECWLGRKLGQWLD